MKLFFTCSKYVQATISIIIANNLIKFFIETLNIIAVFILLY